MTDRQCAGLEWGRGDMEKHDEGSLAALLAERIASVDSDKLAEAVASENGKDGVVFLERLQASGALSRSQRDLLCAMIVGVRHAEQSQLDEALKTLTSGTLPVGSVSGPPTKPASYNASGPILDPSEWEVTAEVEGRYVIRDEVGRGGQARVMIAFDRHIRREIAWKEIVLSDTEQEDSREGGFLGTRASRFLREARITGRLEHPNIVSVYEVGRRDNGALYYTMRLVHGKTLDQKLKACAGLTERMALLGAFWDACNAVAYAHNHGVIHRDLKPANIMVGEFGETVLLDWGLAKVRGTEDVRGGEIAERASTIGDVSGDQTVSGAAIGTPCYMSPEQAQGIVEEIDERSDVWGLGAVLYEILTGHPPFEGPKVQEILKRVLASTPKPIFEVCPHAPPELVAVASKALQKPKDQRYASARELAMDVAAYMTGQRVRAHEYSSWELLKRFAARNRPAIVALSAVFLVIVVALIVVSIAYRKEADARHHARQEQLHAQHHLAEAHIRQAERLAEQKDLLNAKVFAISSLINNPAYPSSPFYDPGFLLREPDGEWLTAVAKSIVFQASHGIVTRLSRTLKMNESVYSIAFSPDGTVVAGGDSGGELRVWDSNDGSALGSYKAHSGSIWKVAFSPDGRRIATCGVDHFVNVFQLGEQQPILRVSVGQTSASSIAYAPDGRSMVIGLEDGRVKAVDVASGEVSERFPPHLDKVRGVAFSPDGRFLASGSWDKTARLHDAATGEVRHTLVGHTGAVCSVAFSPDGRTIASAGYDMTVRLWDAETGRWEGTLEGARDAVFSAAFSSDGSRVVAGCADRTVRIWDRASRMLLATLQGHRDDIDSVAVSASGQLLASGSRDRTIRLWETGGRDGLLRLEHGDWIAWAAYSPDGKWIATSGSGEAIRIWDAQTGKEKTSLAGHKDTIYTVAFSPNSRWLVSASLDRTLRVWDTESWTSARRLLGHEGGLWSADFSPDGTKIVSAARDRTARVWEASSGTELAVLRGHKEQVYHAAYSPDSRLIATASGDRLVRLWDASTYTLVRELAGHTDWVSAASFSPDGRYLYTSGKDRVAIQWDLATGRPIRRYEGHEQWVNWTAPSPDGRLLTTASDDGTAVVWDTTSGRPLFHLRGSGAVNGAFFSPDGHSLGMTHDTTLVVYPLAQLLSPDSSPKDQDLTAMLIQAERAAGMRLKSSALVVGDDP